jgi:hypothetical protein
MNKLRYIFYALFVLMVPLIVFGQDLILEDYTTSGNKYLNTLVFQDTSSAEFKAGTRVYVLKKDGIYLQNTTMAFANKVVKFRAEYGGTGHYDPTVYLYPASGGNPPGNFADLAGGSISLKHILVTGYYEAADSNLDRLQGSLIRLNTSGSGGSIYIDSCILKSVNGQAIRTEGKPTTVRVTNSIIADMGFTGTSNFGAGKALDLRDQDVDTCDIQNNTFVNYLDRVVRHYQATKGPIRNFYFNHNTVVNSTSYHGFLSLGRVDSSGDGKLEIKNNMFVDHFALGADTAYIRQVEFGDPGENDTANGKPRMAWVLTNRNLAAKWDISNNYYAVSDSGQAMLNLALPNGPYYQNAGPALTWGMNTTLASQGKDTLNTFKKVKVKLANTPPLMTKMIRWIYRPRADGGDGKEKNANDPNFTKDSPGHWTYDYNRKPVEYYFDTLNCKIAASPTTAVSLVSTDGKPVGDPRWGPPVASIPDDFIIVDGNKDAFYNSLTGPSDGYLQIRSCSYSDNGAPKSDADLSAKVWTAWDPTWFYLYEEVMDDTIKGTGANAYQDDCIELKFDPQPWDSVANSIFGVNLTILGQGTPGVASSDSLIGVPNIQKQWARKIITGGYALELAINWPAIKSGTEVVSVAVDSVFGFGLNNHDNDATTRQASIIWAAFKLDAIWNTPKYLGTAKFLAGNKMKFTTKNYMTGKGTNPDKYDGTDVPLGVKETQVVPRVFALEQNYPNPFNPTTNVVYSVPKQTKVKLEVFDLLGRKVATLVDETKEAGQYAVRFGGPGLSSGVYIYRLSSPSQTITKKMLLMK